MGRLTTLHEAANVPKISARTHDLTTKQVASIAGSAGAQSWGYAREAAVGSLLSIARTNGAATPRFTSPKRGPGYQMTSYNVDGASNRLVRHDSAGRLVMEGTRTYTWDEFSSLTTVRESGQLLEALQYDGLGRLVARWNHLGLVEEVAYDGAQMVVAWVGANNVKWSANWAPGIDALLSVKDGIGDYLALEDGKANVVGYVGADDSQLAGHSEFNPEGRVKWNDYRSSTACDETGNTRCGSLLGFPFGFHGAYKSEATGLMYFRNRWYSSEAGQWLSQDPLGYVDSYNLYAFNKFDAVNFVDPWGLVSRDMSLPCTEDPTCKPLVHRDPPPSDTTPGTPAGCARKNFANASIASRN